MRSVPATWSHWSVDDFSDALPTAIGDLTSRVLGYLAEDGALRSPCDSRVLESALALALLTRTYRSPLAALRLSAYLERHGAGADPFDRVLPAGRSVVRRSTAAP